MKVPVSFSPYPFPRPEPPVTCPGCGRCSCCGKGGRSYGWPRYTFPGWNPFPTYPRYHGAMA